MITFWVYKKLERRIEVAVGLADRTYVVGRIRVKGFRSSISHHGDENGLLKKEDNLGGVDREGDWEFKLKMARLGGASEAAGDFKALSACHSVRNIQQL